MITFPWYVLNKCDVIISKFSVVGIVIGYGLDNRGGRSSSPGRIKDFLFTSSRPALGSTQPPIQWVPEALSTGVKRPGREADRSSPASAEIMNSPIRLHGVVLN
jgi:hypothetical protein